MCETVRECECESVMRLYVRQCEFVRVCECKRVRVR